MDRVANYIGGLRAKNSHKFVDKIMDMWTALKNTVNNITEPTCGFSNDEIGGKYFYFSWNYTHMFIEVCVYEDKNESNYCYWMGNSKNIRDSTMEEIKFEGTDLPKEFKDVLIKTISIRLMQKACE